MIIQSQGEQCWICGSKNKLTQHHTIPKHFKPLHNFIIPICRKCHERLNEQDFQSLYPFLTKISLSLKGIEGAINRTNGEFKEIEKKLKLGGFLSNEKIKDS